jgi:hypothetical protein
VSEIPPLPECHSPCTIAQRKSKHSCNSSTASPECCSQRGDSIPGGRSKQLFLTTWRLLAHGPPLRSWTSLRGTWEKPILIGLSVESRFMNSCGETRKPLRATQAKGSCRASVDFDYSLRGNPSPLTEFTELRGSEESSPQRSRAELWERNPERGGADRTDRTFYRSYRAPFFCEEPPRSRAGYFLAAAPKLGTSKVRGPFV